jgi:hypothetical protein
MAGGGVGEAMLISAVTGAGTAAVTGGDPLKGALLGAATGGIGHGIAGATAGGGAGAASGAGSATTTAGTQAVTDQAVQQGLSGLPAATDPTSIINATGDTTFTSAFGGPESALRSANYYPADSLAEMATDEVLANMPQGVQQGVQQGVTQTASNPMFPKIAEMSKSGYFYPGLGAASSLIGAGPETKMPGEEEYDGPLSRFNYDPDRYRPYRAASGGLMDTEPARRMAAGGLGSYSDGGQMLKGPGDGMSDDIPASIEDKQPARLADGEFVVPADVVSGIGNGSTDAGAEALYAMLDRVRKARTGRTEQAPEIDAQRMMPA